MRAGLALLLCACAPATPDAPTWLADVRPILEANCVRCHGSPSLGGAPAGFRLDVYGTETLDGLNLRGARDMADYVWARAVDKGDMPPRGAKLSDRQKEILTAWKATVAPGNAAGNQAPTVTVNQLSSSVERELRLDVLVGDPDGDPVIGELLVRAPGGARPDASLGRLHAGRQELRWDVGVLPPGSYTLVAWLDDQTTGDRHPDAIPVLSHDIGPRDNAAPQVAVLSPARDALLVAGEGPFDVQLSIVDEDRSPDLELEAFHGDTRVSIPVTGRREEGAITKVPWDFSALAPGPSWRVRATVTDPRGATRTAVSGQFIVSRTTTGLRYADVKPILDGVCANCHHDVNQLGDFRELDQVQFFRGRAWRRVAQVREMPPPSYRVLYRDGPELTEEQRGQLSEWLLAGAPR